MLSRTSHVHSEIYLHLNWHCKHDAPQLKGPVEEAVHASLANGCARSRGVRFLGVGGTETHVHLAVQIQPFVCLGEWAGKMKGGSAHEINRRFGKGTLEWQRGYGVVSFAEKNLSAVLRYVAAQKEHHAQGRLREGLERSEETPEGDGEAGEAR